MKQVTMIIVLVLIAILSMSYLTMKDGKVRRTAIYDTIYVMSQYNFRVIDDSTLKKEILTDTLHSKDSAIAEFPIHTMLIIKIDTLWTE